jgi:hypothetical protein
MIESCYWKEELLRIAKLIQPVLKPCRWTERSHCVVERDVMIGFFIVRRLIEFKKVSAKVRDFKIEVYSCPNRGKYVTLLNRGELDKLYHVNEERKETKTPLYIANQFVHAYTSFVARDETRNWWSMYVVSDFDRNDCIWRVPIDSIRALFLSASKDYPHSVSWTYNPDKRDYDISAR